jgi:hypothetical protein
MKFIQPILLLSITTMSLLACKKHVIEPLPVTSASGMANLKIVHAMAYPTNVAMQLKVNDVRVSNNITYSTPFPGGGLNTGGSNFPWYLLVKPGPNKISVSYPKYLSSNDSVMLHSSTVTLDANKYYTLYITDTGSLSQSVLVPENVGEVNDGVSRYKFVNLTPNVAALDLYFAGNLVAGNIPYKGTSAEFTLPYKTTGQWAIRPAGAASTSTALAIYPTGTTTQTIPNKRILSVYSRGYSGGTGNRAPAISLLYN